MLEQLPIYLLCYLIGWVPLYYIYRQLEALIPFNLKQSKAVFSVLPFVHLIYLSIEVLRGYLIMAIVHDWLIYDIDLILGVALFLLAIGFPVYIPAHYRTRVWLSIIGIYFYLFPLFIWLIPVVLLSMFFLSQSAVLSYSIIGVLFLIIGFIQGGNSLYIMLYCCLFFYLIMKTYLHPSSSSSKRL